MKKKIFGMMIAAAAVCAMLAGCDGKTTDGKDNNPVTTKSPDNQAEEEKPKTAEDFFMDFLNGETKVKVTDYNAADYFSHKNGEYTFEELKKTYMTIVSEMFEYNDEAQFLNTRYAIISSKDNGNGVKSDADMLVISIRDLRRHTEWLGFIVYDNGKLKLIRHENTVERSYAVVQANGILETGGSYGAGAHTATFDKITSENKFERLYKCDFLDSAWCSEALRITCEAFGKYYEPYDYVTIPNDSELAIRIIVFGKNSEVRFAVVSYSSDEAIKEKEDKIVKSLEELGAVQVTGEDLDKQLEQVGREGNNIKWNDLGDFTDKSGTWQPVEYPFEYFTALKDTDLTEEKLANGKVWEAYVRVNLAATDYREYYPFGVSWSDEPMTVSVEFRSNGTGVIKDHNFDVRTEFKWTIDKATNTGKMTGETINLEFCLKNSESDGLTWFIMKDSNSYNYYLKQQ